MSFETDLASTQDQGQAPAGSFAADLLRVKKPTAAPSQYISVDPNWGAPADASPKPSPYDAIIDLYAKDYDVPQDLVRSMINVESSGIANAVGEETTRGRGRARGLMQLMPATAKQYGVTDPFNPEQNIRAGVQYLADLRKLFPNDDEKVIAAYHAGQGAVARYGGIPPYKDTQAYVPKVQSGRGAYQRADPGSTPGTPAPSTPEAAPRQSVVVPPKPAPVFDLNPPDPMFAPVDVLRTTREGGAQIGRAATGAVQAVKTGDPKVAANAVSDAIEGVMTLGSPALIPAAMVSLGWTAATIAVATAASEAAAATAKRFGFDEAYQRLAGNIAAITAAGVGAKKVLASTGVAERPAWSIGQRIGEFIKKREAGKPKTLPDQAPIEASFVREPPVSETAPLIRERQILDAPAGEAVIRPDAPLPPRAAQPPPVEPAAPPSPAAVLPQPQTLPAEIVVPRPAERAIPTTVAGGQWPPVKAEPGAVLLHGTSPEAAEKILREGMVPDKDSGDSYLTDSEKDARYYADWAAEGEEKIPNRGVVLEIRVPPEETVRPVKSGHPNDAVESQWTFAGRIKPEWITVRPNASGAEIAPTASPTSSPVSTAPAPPPSPAAVPPPVAAPPTPPAVEPPTAKPMTQEQVRQSSTEELIAEMRRMAPPEEAAPAPPPVVATPSGAKPIEGEKQSGVLDQVNQEERLSQKKARLKEIGAEMKRRFGGALDIKTKADLEAFKALSREGADILYEIKKPLMPERVKSGRDSTLDANVIAVAHGDLLRQKPVYDVISDAAHGVHFDADTAVDDVMNGKNPGVSPAQLRAAFGATREALRAQFGDTITLYRAQGKQKQKATTNWASTRTYAAQFGDNVVERKIPVDDIVAVNVGPTGTYEELIVASTPSGAEVAKAKFEAKAQTRRQKTIAATKAEAAEQKLDLIPMDPVQERREMARLLVEMNTGDFTPTSYTNIGEESTYDGMQGLASGFTKGQRLIGTGRATRLRVSGAAGAPVYDDILAHMPGASRPTRAGVIAAIQAWLDTGKMTNATIGALEVARIRAGLSLPRMSHKMTAPMPFELSELDLNREVPAPTPEPEPPPDPEALAERDAIQAEAPNDVSFDPAEFEPAPAVDVAPVEPVPMDDWAKASAEETARADAPKRADRSQSPQETRDYASDYYARHAEILAGAKGKAITEMTDVEQIVVYLDAPRSENLHPDPERAHWKQLADDDPGVIETTLRQFRDIPRLKRLVDLVVNGGRMVNKGKYLWLLDARGKIVGRVDNLGYDEIVDLPLDALEKGETQDRGMPQDMKRVEAYAELKTKAPMIAAHGPRFDGDTYQIIDGHHRYEAAKLRGDKTIRVEANIVFPKTGQAVHVAKAGQENGVVDGMARFRNAVDTYAKQQPRQSGAEASKAAFDAEKPYPFPAKREAQPDLPGTEGVRSVENKTPEFELPFALLPNKQGLGKRIETPDLLEAAEPKAEVANPERDALIERIVAAARRQEWEVVPKIELLGTDGKWHGAHGFPFGVKMAGDQRTIGYVSRAPDGTTHGKIEPTADAVRDRMRAAQAKNDEDFRANLIARSPEDLKEAANYWLKEKSKPTSSKAEAERDKFNEKKAETGYDVRRIEKMGGAYPWRIYRKGTRDEVSAPAQFTPEQLAEFEASNVKIPPGMDIVAFRTKAEAIAALHAKLKKGSSK